MAYVINPDGTVRVVEVSYDSSGNMSVKRAVSDAIDVRDTLVAHNYMGKSSKRRFKHKEKIKNSQTSHKVDTQFFKSSQEIQEYFKKRVKNKIFVSERLYREIASQLSGKLLKNFRRQYQAYLASIGKVDPRKGTYRSVDASNKKNAQGKAKKERCIKSADAQFYDRDMVGNRKTYVHGRSVYCASCHPKYGYARDRFGRVQERDKYSEDRRNEFAQSQRYQNHYDYSSYDREDDHDGTYSDYN